MISKERFERINKNDFILFKSGKARKVTEVTVWENKGKKRVLLRFDKVNGTGYTIYMYADLKDKITAIIKQKNNNNERR